MHTKVNTYGAGTVTNANIFFTQILFEENNIQVLVGWVKNSVQKLLIDEKSISKVPI